MNKSRGRGRPPGRSTTRDDILAVARRRFLADGYAGVTLRSLAAEAGVDAALISYHFGSKRGLFGAALQLSINPTIAVARALEGPLESLPERLLRTLLVVWDDPERRGPLLGLMSRITTEPEVTQLFREVAERELFGRIAERLGGHERQASAAATQLAGLIFLRYVLRVEPLASMTADEVVAVMAPPLRVALGRTRAGSTGRVGAGGVSAERGGTAG